MASYKLYIEGTVSLKIIFLKVEAVELDSEKFWHLGSLLCRSNYTRVCGSFIVFPLKTDQPSCSGPGCKIGEIQDLNNHCENLETFSYNKSMVLERAFLWRYSSFLEYITDCRANLSPKAFNCE